jgi:hypothetical protein
VSKCLQVQHLHHNLATEDNNWTGHIDSDIRSISFVEDNSTKMNNKRLRNKIENINYELKLKRMN